MEQSVMKPEFDNAETRVKKFLDEIYPESASVNILERELTQEKCKKRKIEEKLRKIKYRVRLVMEEYKATEIQKDNCEKKICVLEHQLNASQEITDLR